MMDPPMVHWPAKSNSLYTLMVIDVGLPDGMSFFHYLIGNIPGNDIKNGTVVLDWVKPILYMYRNDIYYECYTCCSCLHSPSTCNRPPMTRTCPCEPATRTSFTLT